MSCPFKISGTLFKSNNDRLQKIVHSVMVLDLELRVREKHHYTLHEIKLQRFDKVLCCFKLRPTVS